MNKIIVHGRLTRDPETKNTETSSVCTFTVAENQRFNRDLCNFHDCEAWGKTGDFVAQYFRKGSEIVVSGDMRQRKYVAKDGTNRTAWSINVDAVDFCGKSENAGQNNPKTPGAAQPAVAPNLVELNPGEELPF